MTARTARARAAETQAALDAAIARRDLLARRQHAQRRTDLARLAVEERAAIEALEAAQVDLEQRAANAYIRGNLAPVGLLLSSHDATQYFHRPRAAAGGARRRRGRPLRLQDARAAVDDSQAETAAHLAGATRGLPPPSRPSPPPSSSTSSPPASSPCSSPAATSSSTASCSRSPGRRSSATPSGSPRMPGTDYEHWHEGTDILAAAGTPLVACERGVITRMGTNVLGGITVWLRGESGVSYYYAHLSGFGPGVGAGIVVEPATVLGFVGNTGNAQGTPPHLHFEVHPHGGVASTRTRCSPSPSTSSSPSPSASTAPRSPPPRTARPDPPGSAGGGRAWKARGVDVVADLDAPHPAAVVWEVVSDLGTYPEWLDIVGRAVPAGDAAWTVDLRGKLGPFTRSKRLRMARTLAQAPNNVLFEREELDGKEHSAWVLRAEASRTRAPRHARCAWSCTTAARCSARSSSACSATPSSAPAPGYSRSSTSRARLSSSARAGAPAGGAGRTHRRSTRR